MKLAVIYTPKIWNVGNDFINQGARIIINKFKHKYESVIELESLESGNLNLKYRTDFISKYGDAVLSDLTEEDTLIVVGGSCLSRYMVGMFDQIVNKYSCKKILLGAGFYENLDAEGFMYRDLPKQFDAIFVRDKNTWEVLSNRGKFENVYDGLDLAFWLDEDKEHIMPSIKNFPHKYSAVNIDSPENFNLQKKFYEARENTILSWNNPTQIGFFNSEVYKPFRKFVGESYYGYIRFYAKAEFVYTNRIHTFLICLLFDVPCHLLIAQEPRYHRYYLFHSIGLEIRHGKVYKEQDYKKAKEIMAIKKETMLDNLKKYL